MGGECTKLVKLAVPPNNKNGEVEFCPEDHEKAFEQLRKDGKSQYVTDPKALDKVIKGLKGSKGLPEGQMGPAEEYGHKTVGCHSCHAAANAVIYGMIKEGERKPTKYTEEQIVADPKLADPDIKEDGATIKKFFDVLKAVKWFDEIAGEKPRDVSKRLKAKCNDCHTTVEGK